MAPTDVPITRFLGSTTGRLVFAVGLGLIAFSPLSSLAADALRTTMGRTVVFLAILLLARADLRLAAVLALLTFVVSYSQRRRDADRPASRMQRVLPGPPEFNRSLNQQDVRELDLQAPIDVEETGGDGDTSGVLFERSGETEVGRPLHPDLLHSGPQSLGDPLPGFESDTTFAPVEAS